PLPTLPRPTAGTLVQSALPALVSTTPALPTLPEVGAAALVSTKGLPATTGVALYLRGRVLQGWTDLVGLPLEDGALLTLAGLEAQLAKPTSDDYAVALVRCVGHGLRSLAPDVAGEEKCLAVDALTCLRGVARRAGFGSVYSYCGTRLGVAQLPISNNVADQVNWCSSRCHCKFLTAWVMQLRPG